MRYLIFFILIGMCCAYGDPVEINGSPYATEGVALPKQLHTQEKTILIDPNEHLWGAYNATGKLIRWGIASAGANWCADIRTACRTRSGTYRIYSLGSGECVSTKYPIPTGGAPMPYCMYFNGNEAIHGSDNVTYGNNSHGCIRINTKDAKWLRENFAERPSTQNHYQGTRVIIRPYQIQDYTSRKLFLPLFIPVDFFKNIVLWLKPKAPQTHHLS
jgi:hypothetical protein